MRIGARSALKIQFQIVGIINRLRYSAKIIIFNSNILIQSFTDTNMLTWGCIFHAISRVTSRLVTDVWNEMCWRLLLVVGDGFVHNGHQHSLSLYTVAGKQHSKDVTFKCHQHRNSVTNIHKSSTTLKLTRFTQRLPGNVSILWMYR